MVSIKGLIGEIKALLNDKAQVVDIFKDVEGWMFNEEEVEIDVSKESHLTLFIY